MSCVANLGLKKVDMFNGLYSSASALNMNLHQQDLIAHNLAHVNVHGFKRSLQTVSTFEDFLPEGMQPNDPEAPETTMNIDGSRIVDQVTDFSQGRIEDTGDPLNVALNGNGFFVVQGQDGPLYTRNGNFKLNENSELCLAGGQVVQGEGGPIQINDVNSLKIYQDGTVMVNDAEVGRLQAVNFDPVQDLVPAGTTLFLAPPELNPQPIERGAIQFQQGHLEMSNTQAVNELIRMIAGMRHFEAAQKSLTTISESISKHTSLQSA